VATRRRASKRTLTGNITDLQRRVRYLQAKPVPSRLANQVVTRSAIQPRAVSTDQIALAAVTNDQVAADAIRQEQLAELSVGNPEIQDDAILNRNIAANAVNNESIDIDAVGLGEMQDNSVGSAEIIDGSVGNAELADNSVGSAEIQTNAVGQAEIAPNSVGTAELINLSVTTAKLADLAITTEKIANDQITKQKMRADSVGAREIINFSVTTAQISGGGPDATAPAVTAAKIADSAVQTDKINNLAVTAAKIGNLAVTTGKIANTAVTFEKIANEAVTTAKIADNAVVIGKIPTATRGSIVNSGLTTANSIIKTFVNNVVALQLRFGPGSTEVARGNHTHTVDVGDLGGIIRTTSAPSTLKVKKDVNPYKPTEIKNLLKLEPKSYKYKRSERGYHQALNKELMHGYIVEELLDLGFSEPVGYDKDGSPATLDYGLMSLLVLELVKVQQTEIDSLKEEVLRLKDTK
jgi:hypothetical protein